MPLHRYSNVALFVCMLAFGACKESEPNYCATARDHNCMELDAPVSDSCTSDRDCSGATAVCDLSGSKKCVQCTPTDNPCVAATPVCAANQCQKCTMHAECPTSNVCLPDGTCADATQVAYVQSGGTGAPPCAKAAPCGTLADGVTANKPTVKMATGTVADSKTTTIDGKTVTILADPGAKLSRSNPGVILQVQNDGADVKIFDLEITLGTGMGNAAISIPNGGAPSLALTRVTADGNQGVAISASGGTLTVSASTISGNTGGGISASGGTLTVSASTISGNTGGGISVSAVGATNFDIENNFIIYNGVGDGLAATPTGGASLLPNSDGSKFIRNTVAFNKSNGTFHGGVTCASMLVSAIGNIVYGNTEGMIKDDTTQRGGSCQFGNTLALGSTPGDLGFKSPFVTPFDFHLTAASPTTVVDAAGSCTGVDFDRETRPIGAACDLGADEYHP